jgi:glycine/D-amino acid oxidase-like deaminating enzyme
MDLRSGRPFWPIKNGVLNRYSALDRDVCCEVVILGAGITGALVAYHLAKERIPVVILDRREVGTGSTSATTGLLQYEVDTPLFKLAGAIGEKKAARSYHLSIEAIQKIECLLGELGDNCGFERKQSLYLASRKEHVEDLKREYSARESTGIRLDFLWAEAIQARFGLASPAALLSYDAGQVDAYRLTHALLRSALSFGVQVYDQTEVSAYRTSKEGVEAITKTGHRIRCRKMVFAIGYEIPRCLQRDIVQLKSTYAGYSSISTSATGPDSESHLGNRPSLLLPENNRRRPGHDRRRGRRI